MSDLITDEMVEAAAAAVHDLGCFGAMVGEPCNCYRHAGDASHVEARAALEAVAPLIAAKALRDAADEVSIGPESEGLRARAERFERGEL